MDQIQYYNPDEFLETQSGNKIHKRVLIKGSEQIQLQGKVIMREGMIIRGDIAKVSMGKYVIIHEYVSLKPSHKKVKGQIKFIPLQIGDYVIIDQNTIIQSARIGSYVNIGKNCIISHRVIIGDNVIILDDSIVPPDTVIPSYCVFGGRPANYILELPETSKFIFKERAQNYYKNLVPRKPSEERK